MAIASWRRAFDAAAGLGLIWLGRGPQELDGRCVGCCGAVGLQRFVPLSNVSWKQRVDEMEDAGLAAEVARERQPACLVNFAAELRELGRLGAAEAVDRLLEVADEEQAAFVEAGAADYLDEVDLEWIGVLKFVDQEQPQIVGECFANGVAGIGE